MILTRDGVPGERWFNLTPLVIGYWLLVIGKDR
jgi:hypothetical protein